MQGTVAFGRWMCAAILTVGVAAILYAEEDSAYKHAPVAVNCKIFGRFVECTATPADDLVEQSWVYEKYTAHGGPVSGPIQITKADCRPITFFGTDPVNWSTFVISVQVRLKGGRATFKDCPNVGN